MVGSVWSIGTGRLKHLRHPSFPNEPLVELIAMAANWLTNKSHDVKDRNEASTDQLRNSDN